ncbi:uncharacterized protein LOC112087752 [Eutrema salsugineum]|uniref:uncharacterized protein LOC112087752 n=1 Tax=Eutrema salsugineum TaxID=72664 RepID=UPI000CECF404|nr:uncharacterized protein LOC112087752 [Eutrema salsugineum]
MLQLKHCVVDFMSCVIGNGDDASFCYDSWKDLGPLISFVGDNGPRQLQIHLDAHIVHASQNGMWRMPAARSEEAQALQIALSTITPPSVDRGRDQYLWRNDSGTYVNVFSSKVIWELIRSCSPQVSWDKIVWFKEPVPSHSFITWLAMLSRLPTKDRLRRWGLNGAPECVLCSGGLETHMHLFFECQFSSAIWNCFASSFWPNAPLDLVSIVAWISQNQVNHRSGPAIIIWIILQALVYIL